jgi:hypothetical protein
LWSTGWASHAHDVGGEQSPAAPITADGRWQVDPHACAAEVFAAMRERVDNHTATVGEVHAVERWEEGAAKGGECVCGGGMAAVLPVSVRVAVSAAAGGTCAC